MFRLNLIDEHVAYVTEMQRRAERHQLILEALAGRRGRVAFYAPAMVELGKRMMAWGYRLQTRYTTVPPITLTMPKRSM